MKSLLKISFRNVFLHWRQSLAAIISLAAGLVSIVMFQGYMDDVKRMYVETFRSRMMYGDLIVEHQKLTDSEGRAEPWKYGISPQDQKQIEQILAPYQKEISSVTRFLQVTGVVTNGNANPIFMGYGYDLKAGEKTRGSEWAWNTLYGSPLRDDHPNTLVVGQLLGHYLGCRPIKKQSLMDSVAGYKAEVRPFRCESSDVQLSVVTIDGQLNALDLEVSGLVDALYKDVDDKFLAMDLSTSQTLMNTQDISYVTVKFHDSSIDLAPVIKHFESEIKNRNLPYRILRWQDHIVGDMYVRTMSLLSVFRNFVMSIIIAIAGLSIFNTMMKIVKERTREIGTLQSLGFLRRQIVFIFVSEAILLSIAGGVIGSVFAFLSTLAVNALGIVYKAGILVEPVPLKILINPNLYGLSFLLLSAMAAITTWLICRSAVRRKTSENLTFS